MTKRTDALAKKIAEKKQQHAKKINSTPTHGYQTAIEMITNLFGCVIIGLSLGVLCHNLFNTSSLLTAGFTIFGGFAGLWSVIRYAMKR